MQRCDRCMREYEIGKKTCPYCGYDPASKPDFDCLPAQTVIAERFTVGVPLKKDSFGYRYIAYDSVSDKKVTVAEYMPEGAVRGADGRSVSAPGNEESFAGGVSEVLSKASALSEFDYFEAMVRIIDCGLENNTAYIITEFLEGETVKEIIADEGQYSFRNTVADITPVIRALSGIHRAGFYHGNITPENIMICKNGKVKLTGFSYFCERDNEESAGFAPKEAYDESASGSPAGDIYSVSAVLYFMLTGKIPADSRRRGTAQDDFVPLCGTGDIPPDAEDAIMKGMSINPDDRPADAEEILNALLGKKKSFKLNEKLEDPHEQPPSEKTEDEGKKNNKNIIPIAAAILTALVGIALIILAVKLLPYVRNQQSGNGSNTTTAPGEDIPLPTERAEEVSILPAQAKEIYLNYFRSMDFRERYAASHAVRIKDIDLYETVAELPRGVKSLDSGKFTEYFYDIDGDGVNECLIVTDLNGDLRYVNVFIFDIDENSEVFEGGRIEYDAANPEEMRLCTARVGTASVYYLLRYVNSSGDEELRSFEILYYNGRDLICSASAGKPADSPGDYAFTGIALSSDGVLWNPASPSMQMSLYPYDEECYIQSPDDYSLTDGDSFENIWMRNVNSADEKLLLKSTSRIRTSVQVSVLFPGLELGGEDIQLERRTPSGSEIFLYTADGRPLQFARTIEKRQLESPYVVEIYYGEYRYVSCTIALDENEEPVYSQGDVELAKLPDVRMMRREAAVNEIKNHGFTDISYKNGLSHGLSGLRNIGKVEKINVVPDRYYPKDTPILLTIYR